MPEPDLSVIIVSWNVRELLGKCLASLNAPFAMEVIVVDNASSDGTVEMLAEKYPWARVIPNRDNRGFTRANNQGLAVSRGRYVFFLNPDTEAVGDALALMYRYMEAHPEAGAVGPQLRYGDGSLQSSRRCFPTPAMALFESTPVAWHWPAGRNRWARRYHMDDAPMPGPGDAQRVDWVVGAALWVRRSALDQVGGFDEGYFMYSEELDWCRRASAAGWQVMYLPAACVIHHEGKSSEQAVAARHIRFQTSKVRYFRKFHGALPAAALRWAILAQFALEWLIEAAKYVADSRRPLRRSRMAAYAQLLRSRLRENVEC